MLKLLKYIGEYKKHTILTLIMVLGQVVMEVFIPFEVGKMFDVGIKQGIKELIPIAIILLIISFAALFFGYYSAIFSSIASDGFGKNLRKAVFKKIQEYSFSNIDKFSNSSLITRLTNDVDNIVTSFVNVIMIMFRSPLMLVGTLIMAIFTSYQLSIVFAIAVPSLMFIFFILIKLSYDKFIFFYKKIDSINLTVKENLSAIKVIKSFVRENYEIEKFQNEIDGLKKINADVIKAYKLSFPLSGMVIFSCLCSVVWFGGNLVIKGDITLGQMSSFLIYVYQILANLMMITSVFATIILSGASRKRVMEILDEKIDLVSPESNLKLKDGSIEYKNINFGYDKNNKKNLILKNINLKIESGENISIIGNIGSGKSSLVNLLPRLFDVISGNLIVGGHDVKKYNLKYLRDNIAVVLQKNVLFSGTIKENILWGNENATDEEIKIACQQAQAEDFILSMKNKYDTLLERGATNLSGGQKQRLCIARALLKKPKILILDDSTSALDTSTDNKIRKIFKEKLLDMTKIVVTQRVINAKDSDRIIVMDKGEINGIGTNDFLLKNNQIYKEIYYSQQD